MEIPELIFCSSHWHSLRWCAISVCPIHIDTMITWLIWCFPVFFTVVVWLLNYVQLFCNSMDYNLPVSSVHGIFQARILEWVDISFSRGSYWPRDRSYISCIVRQNLYHWATWEAQLLTKMIFKWQFPNYIMPTFISWHSPIRILSFPHIFVLLFTYIHVDSWTSLLFNGSWFIPIIIYFLLELASRTPFKRVPLSFPPSI